MNAIGDFLQPSVRFFNLLSDDPLRVYITAALWVAFIRWSSKKAMRFLQWLVNEDDEGVEGDERVEDDEGRRKRGSS